jgi:hypothetical protein
LNLLLLFLLLLHLLSLPVPGCCACCYYNPLYAIDLVLCYRTAALCRCQVQICERCHNLRQAGDGTHAAKEHCTQKFLDLLLTVFGTEWSCKRPVERTIK